MSQAKTKVKPRRAYKQYSDSARTSQEERALIIYKKKKRKQKEIDRLFFNIASFILLPILLVFFAEIIARGSIIDSTEFLFNNFGIVFLNISIIYFVYFFFQCLFNNVSASFVLTSFIYLLVPVVSKLKYDVRGEVLLTSDFVLLSNAQELASFATITETMISSLIVSLIFIVFINLLLMLHKNKTKRIDSIMLMLLTSIFLFFTFFSPIKNKILKKFGIDNNIRYSVNVIAEKYGSVVGLFSNRIMNEVVEPDNYSQETVFNILDKTLEEHEDIPDNKVLVKNEVQPNVIMIMSESFFDPTNIKRLSYSEDPIPNIRSYMNKYQSGQFITSVFAGGTSNVEFEAFTGDSVQFLPYGMTVYNSLKDNLKDIDTLPKIMKDNGYNTIALHTYDGNFYSRNEVYPDFGFDKFLDMNEMVDVGYYGKYVSDNTLVNNIIKQLEENNESSDKPAFIWGLSMQNHTPYSTANFDKAALTIEVSGENLSELGKDKITAYTNCLHQTDKTMKTLLDYLDNSKIPTVVLFFGDHLPSLYETYYDAGMISSKDTTLWNLDEMYNMHKGLFFIYDNLKVKGFKYSHDEVVGNAFLGNYLLNYLGMEKPIYFNFLDTLNYVSLRDRLVIDKDMNKYISYPDNCVDKINEHKILEYDMIYGKKYLLEWTNRYLTI